MFRCRPPYRAPNADDVYANTHCNGSFPVMVRVRRLLCNSLEKMVSLAASIRRSFLADRILTVALLVQCCVRLSSVVCTECVVAKRFVLEQKLLLRAYRKSYIREIDWYQNEWPWPSFTGRIKVMSTIAPHSALNISETVRDKGLVPKNHYPPIGNVIWTIEWSRNGWRHVTLKGQTCDPNTLRAQYLENGWI